jgi:AcrR family transcriptional regulator
MLQLFNPPRPAQRKLQRMNLTPRQLQRRERILETVRQQLSKAGYEGLSMRDVAAASDVSPTTLYNLYDNKDGLVLAALDDLLTQLATSVPAELQGLEGVVARSRAYAQNIVRNPRYAEAMARMLFNARSTDPIAKMLLHNGISFRRQSLVEMQAIGEMRMDIDLDFFAQQWAVSSWSAILLWTHGHIPLEEFEESYVRAELHALLPGMTPAQVRIYGKFTPKEDPGQTRGRTSGG